MRDEQYGLTLVLVCQGGQPSKDSVAYLEHGLDTPLSVRGIAFILSPNLGIVGVVQLVQITKVTFLQRRDLCRNGPFKYL